MSADLFGRRIEIAGMEILRVTEGRSVSPLGPTHTGMSLLAFEVIVRETETADGEHIPTTAEQVANALIALGWTPPAQGDQQSAGFGLYVPIPIEHHPYDPECCPTRDEPGCSAPPLIWSMLTPAEWIQHWDDLTPERRLKKAAIILDNAEKASRCFLMQHDDEIEELRGRLEAASRRPPTPSGETP
jgi:hypothetical protein